MKMRYEAPSALDQAIALLANATGEARVLAGGTDLLVQMKTDVIEPALLVDVKGIAELRQIKEEGGGFRVGAAVSGAELTEHPRLKAVWPGVVEAANLIGSTQIDLRRHAPPVSRAPCQNSLHGLPRFPCPAISRRAFMNALRSMPCSTQASSTVWKQAIGQPTQPILKSRKMRIVFGWLLITSSTRSSNSIGIEGLPVKF